MAMQLQGGGGRGGRGRHRPLAEINVTPLVDVMLVLLIIFMVAAPLLTAGVEVDLPDTDAQEISEIVEPLSVSITADGTIFVQETEIAYDNLVPHLQAVADAGYDQRIYIRGDKGATYDDVAKVFGRINSAGFTRLALVTD
ncbi:MAG: ExbD/TolR family protein [Aquisalinus sp.]|nr:ExbD/TolR family protein [Aquisalinus sp.]